MCWSWEVSLFFVAFQLVSIIYLFRRNLYIDRWYCLIILPFLCQEAVQYFEWAFGDIETATTTSCTPFNRIMSKFLIIIIYSIPVCISIFSFATSQYHPKENSITLSWMWKWIMIKDLNLFPILCILMMIDNECVTVGKYGHQKWWPLLSPKIIEDGAGMGFATFITVIYYYPSIILTAALYKPLWIVWLPALYGMITMALMRGVLGEEGWSVWCWACASVTIWCFIYVPISNWMINKYKTKKQIASNIDINDDNIEEVKENIEEVKDNIEEVKDNNGEDNALIDSLFGEKFVYKIFFEKTQQHFVRYKMMADDAHEFFQDERINFKI